MSLELLGAVQVSMRAPQTGMEVRNPTKVIVSPYKLASSTFVSPAKVRIVNGAYWYSTLGHSHMFDHPMSVVVTMPNGKSSTFKGMEGVAVYGGTLIDLANPWVAVLGAVEATDDFMAAKADTDKVLRDADSSVNLVQHAAVMPFLDQEAKILEGFRRGIQEKNKALVDSATSAMRQLASLARRLFVNPTDGSTKSQTKEAATLLLVNAGGDLEKFKQDVGDTVSWLKWAAIIAAAVGLLIVGGIYIVPFIRRR